MNEQKKEVIHIQTRMSEEEFRKELCYRTSLFVARTLLEDGTISKEEYQKIDTILLKKHQPVLGTLLAGNPLS